MRSKAAYRISSQEVHQWALSQLIDAQVFKPIRGWKCTLPVLVSILLRAAARTCSIPAACRDLAHAPSDQAVFNALECGLPRTLKVLEHRLQRALTATLPKRLLRRRWEVAIDWHLVPYYGQPQRSKNELYSSKPLKGTTKFHAYASACIVSRGVRYTIALTWVRKHESTVTVLRRLLERIRAGGVKIRWTLLDRAFFSAGVMRLLQEENVPFVMPVMLRGRPPRKGRPATGLRWIKRQPAGWYRHTIKSVSVPVCVSYRSYLHRKSGRRKSQKLLFAAWKVKGNPTEIREWYRKRFGIETSYRQWRQARIATCTRNPHWRLLSIAIGLLLRNLWVWIHDTLLSEGSDEARTMHLEQLRFRRMLDWIAEEVRNLLHDGSTTYATG